MTKVSSMLKMMKKTCFLPMMRHITPQKLNNLFCKVKVVYQNATFGLKYNSSSLTVLDFLTVLSLNSTAIKECLGFFPLKKTLCTVHLLRSFLHNLRLPQYKPKEKTLFVKSNKQSLKYVLLKKRQPVCLCTL